MAFNTSSLNALFSKLKPAAKSVAPMADDLANVADDVDDFIPFSSVADPSQFYKDSAAYSDAFDFESMDNSLLNGTPFSEDRYYKRVGEYLSNLQNPTGFWSTKTPLKSDDSRLKNLYDRLNVQLDSNNKFEQLMNQPVSKPRPKAEILKDLDDVNGLGQLLKPTEQLEFEF